MIKTKEGKRAGKGNGRGRTGDNDRKKNILRI